MAQVGSEMEQVREELSKGKVEKCRLSRRWGDEKGNYL